MVSGYSLILRTKIIDRWAELEARLPQVTLPQTFADALRAYADVKVLPKVIPIGMMNKIKTLVKPKKPLLNAGVFVIICFIQISNGSRTPLKVLGVGRFFLTVFDPTPIFHLRKFL